MNIRINPRIVPLAIAPLVLALGLISGTAQAALQGRDLNGSAGSFEAYYDTDLDITWLANANANGAMNWSAANTWAANLSFTDGTNTYADWRLPTNDTPCSGSTPNNCTGSEMGHLFYSELGGTVERSILSSSDADVAKFTNFQADFYWSAREYAPNTLIAWGFNFGNGYQNAGFKSYGGGYALAVSPGDVGAVPEADTWAMLLAGLTLVGAATRRRRG